MGSYYPNHLLKNWPTIFKKFNKMANHSFRGLKPHIRAFLEVCLYSNLTKSEKIKLFLNSYHHFLDHHENCPLHGPSFVWEHKDNPILCQILFQLLNETSKILADSTPGQTTNFNENFHSLKASFVPKAYNLGNSFLGRYACAILQYNHPYMWIIDFLEKLKGHVKIDCHILTQLTTYLTRKAHKLALQKINKQSEANKLKKKKKENEKRAEEIKAKKSEMAHK